MISNAIYFILPFLTALPAVVAFVKLRNASFKNKKLALDFFWYFAFFFFNFFFTYRFLCSAEFSYGYIFKIIDPLFLFFLIKKDLRYAIDKKSRNNIFALMFLNALLQILIHEFLTGVYIYELLDLFALMFSVYIVFYIGREYYFVAYIPKMSRYLLIASIIPCILFDAYIFRIPFISLIFYVCLEKRQLELDNSHNIIKNLRAEQDGFESMMNEISNSIKDFSNKKDAANSYLSSLSRFLYAKGAAIYEWDASKRYFSCIAISGLYFPLGIGSEKLFTKADLLLEMAFKQRIRDERSIIWKCGHSNKTGMFLSHLSDDMDVIFGNLSHEVHSIILVPLLQDSELLGVLVLENKIGSDYLTEADFSMAKNFANFAAIILSTSRMAEQKNEHLRMSMELSSGNVLQSSLFLQKENIPRITGIDVSFFMLPAKEIGGDYYDFFKKGDKLALVIGDVSGKGAPAGILVAILQTYLQNQYKNESNLKKLIIELNSYLSNKINTGMFVTLLIFEWDSKRKKLRYVSCGHEHILHYHSKSKTVECIRSGGLALMMDSDIEPYIMDSELYVEKGDSVILYTDGVTETFNLEKEIFGLERLVKFFEDNKINKDTIEKLLPKKLSSWRGDAFQTDDITCMLMQF